MSGAVVDDDLAMVAMVDCCGSLYWRVGETINDDSRVMLGGKVVDDG